MRDPGNEVASPLARHKAAKISQVPSSIFARLPRQLADTHLYSYSWVERSIVRVKCLAQEHITVILASARAQTARSGVHTHLVLLVVVFFIFLMGQIYFYSLHDYFTSCLIIVGLVQSCS